VLVAKKFGKIVICGATSGYDLTFDARYLWMRQKSIIGSHFANLFQAEKANRLIIEQKVRTVLDEVFDFEQTGDAHERMASNQHMGKMAVRIGCMER
jgi:D-arabinose 1-dehydrogenase-like Zn-dependent alcohol dehydrogenase